MKSIIIIADELYNDLMFLTGVSRCILEVAKILATRCNIVIIGSVFDQPGERILAQRIRMLMSNPGVANQIELVSSVLMVEDVALIITFTDRGLCIAASSIDNVFASVPIVHWNHFSPDDYAQQPCLCAFSERISLLILPTEWERKRLEACFASLQGRIAVIYNAITRPRVSENDSTGLVLFIGRRSWDKGYDIWLSCCYALSRVWPTIRFVAVGLQMDEFVDRIEQNRVELLRQDKLKEVDYLPPLELWELLSRSDVLVLPSRRECMPICVLEAMHLNVPVITSNLPNLVEMAGNPQCFVTVAGLEPECYINAVSAILPNPRQQPEFHIASHRLGTLYSTETLARNIWAALDGWFLVS